MNKPLLQPYQGKQVKLILAGNFCHYGRIDAVEEDCIVFTTQTKTALISFKQILEVVPSE
jgi:hypothetical protein